MKFVPDRSLVCNARLENVIMVRINFESYCRRLFYYFSGSVRLENKKLDKN